MKPLIIYHERADGPCPDGFGAAFAAWLKFGDDAEYLPMQYGQAPEPQDLRDLVDERDVYILDFNLPRAGMDELFRSAKHVVWLDHHKSSFEMWCGKYEKGMRFSDTNGCYGDGNHDIILDDNKSGAMLAWEHFHSGKPFPLLIQHIDDYDRWKFEMCGTTAFNAMLTSYKPWSFAHWTSFLAMHNRMAAAGASAFTCQYYEKVIAEGESILRAHRQSVRAVVNGCDRIVQLPDYNVSPELVDEHAAEFELSYGQAFAEVAEQRCHLLKGLAANCPRHLADDVGNELAKACGTFGLCWYLSSDGVTAFCSLRSIGDYDVEAIAKTFGGGGHKNSAGFEVPIATLLEWLK